MLIVITKHEIKGTFTLNRLLATTKKKSSLVEQEDVEQRIFLPNLQRRKKT